MPALVAGKGAIWLVLAVLLAGARSVKRTSVSSVAVGSAKRDEGSVRPGFINRPGDHRVGE